jgi:hypothetical protein
LEDPVPNLFRALAGGVVTAAWIVPSSAAVITLAVYLPWPGGGGIAVLLGVAGAVVFGLLVSALIAPFASAKDRSNAESWGQLTIRLEALRARLVGLERRSRHVMEATQDLFHVDRMCRYDFNWATKRAYLAVWARLHHAEEVLIEATPIDDLWGVVLKDHLRLMGAQGISPSVALALQDVAHYMADRGGFLRRLQASVARHDVDGLPPVVNDQDARLRLRKVTAAINEFRDASWAGLVRLRNRLLATLCLTGMFAYAILALVVALGAGRWQVISGVTFFLLASVVGLVSQLANLRSATPDRSVDDYGVGIVRVLLIPVLSGLTGLGGVLLTSVLANASVGDLIQAAQAIAGKSRLPVLESIFDLNGNRAGVVFAILFGYAPNLFTGRLDGLVTAYKTAISTTEAGTTQ